MRLDQLIRHAADGPSVPTWALPLAGTALGGLAGGFYGVLCGGIDLLIRWTFEGLLTWGIGFALGGAVAGAVVGLCRLVDRIVSARGFDSGTDADDDHGQFPPESGPPPQRETQRGEWKEPALAGQARAFCDPVSERTNRGTV
jgi:hypothetical protein